MRHAIVGTGRVGALVARRLAARGCDLSVLVRSIEGAARVPARARTVDADVERPESLRRAFEGITHLLLLVPLLPNESEAGCAAVEAARSAGVRRIVYVSAHGAARAPHLAPFASKVAIEGAVEKSGLAWTVLQPADLYQSDLDLRDAILGGAYPRPLGRVGVQRIDARDVAEAATAALVEDGHDGRRYALPGGAAMTGPAVAAAWSRALEREVRYAGDEATDDDAPLPAWRRDDQAELQRHVKAEGLLARDTDAAEQAAILRRTPRRFDAFAAEAVAAWRAREELIRRAV